MTLYACVFSVFVCSGRHRCAMALTKQVGWMSLGCGSDNTTPHYQLTTAETGRRGKSWVGWLKLMFEVPHLQPLILLCSNEDYGS